MELDEDLCSRDYLYGRLLGLADRIEEQILGGMKENRGTNADRLFTAFSAKPYQTWQTLINAIKPYLDKMEYRGKGDKKEQIDEIVSKFKIEDFKSNKPLSGEFLLGYSHQRLNYYKNKKGENKNDSDN